ncbi:alpha/beta fold hydrolase [Massilia horti]|uniref:Alpha/beta hydrolase n=1 Tax=Massilia horti TaxID=2562153 RepID=A0A4Y9T6D7_9BURK|nr:alpha/beta hydrolase [Massilia horti]TFW32785.1 alpha/beta hydrolase [Massilia horti]
MSKPLLHFSHGNSYPAGTYRQLLDLWRDEFDVRALDMHGHDLAYPVCDGWKGLVAELIAQLERYDEPAILVGHSLGGMLSMMAAKERPELARCVVMLDSPVVAGWRALAWRLAKLRGWAGRLSPARFSERRRNVWPSRGHAREHFIAKPIFAAWAPGVLDDYLDNGLEPNAQGVQLRFSRDVETAIYNTLPHHMGSIIREPYPRPVGFIGGTTSEELRQAGIKATRKLVGENLVMIEGGHLYPMQSPAETADATRAMIRKLLGGEQATVAAFFA